MIGLVAGFLCFLAATRLKRALGYDDSLDVFGVHAVGGIVGAILTGLFAFPALGGVWDPGDATIAGQLWVQLKGVLFTVVFTGVLTYVLLKLVDAVMGLRVTAEEESLGLDLALHGFHAADDVVQVAIADDALFGEHFGVGERAANVLAPHALVEIDRGGVAFDEVGGFDFHRPVVPPP